MWRLWRQGQRPAVREFLAEVGVVDPVQVVEVLKVDQRERWMIGQRIPVEAYLEERPSLRENAETLLDLVYSEMLLREEMGEESSLDDVMRRFPELAEDLKSRVDLFKTK
ncbi:MAG: hypothetical protein JOZ63_18085, partial [Planctomycetaceae bacterium]|nr:hypothetical protein [Planctomycetaceae bacterium]